MTPVIAIPTPASLLADADDKPGLGAAWPELPVLSALLRGAARLPVATDWRCGVLAAIAAPAVAGKSAAAVAARAVAGLSPDAGICLAMPVHAVAGISRMFLATADSFALAAPEREALRQAFNAEFGTPDVQMHAAGTGWLLQAPFATAADDGSPESLIGTALARAPALADAGRSLRRLGAELEMWLAGLPLNRDRERRGAPPVNCIWFWGGALAEQLPLPEQTPVGLYSNVEPDAWLAGLAGYCGLPVQHASGWGEVREPRGAVVVLQPELLGDVMRHMSAWEAAWLEPARRDLDAGRLSALRLQIGASAWQLPAGRLTRWLRRKRPWWQVVSA